jgi:pimeloyl-ACP methyl ester carboxylesterase
MGKHCRPAGAKYTLQLITTAVLSQGMHVVEVPNMAFTSVNGVKIYYEEAGSGEIPLVLVHGGWGSHETWSRVVPQLAKKNRVLTYDRRGHSQSERPGGQGSIRDDVADLAALIEQLDLGPAWIVGSSFGGCIALRLAVARPELVLGVIIHEPPLYRLLVDDPSMTEVLQDLKKRHGEVARKIASGDHRGAAKLFMESVSRGPGAWSQIAPARQQALIDNAPTFLDEENDPEAYTIELSSLKQLRKPVLLTKGDQSQPMFAPVVSVLEASIPDVRTYTFPGVGHIPQSSHPEEYVQVMAEFIRAESACDH